jgi:molecular chaperone DnaK
VSPNSPLAELETKLTTLRARATELYADRSLRAACEKKLLAADARLVEAEAELASARGADADAHEKLRRLLLDVDEVLAGVEATRLWPELEEDAVRWSSYAIGWVGQHGSDVERTAVEATHRALERARAARDATSFARRTNELFRLGLTAGLRNKEHVAHLLRVAGGRIGDSRDPKAAKKLVADGEASLQRGELEGARRALHAIWDLLPPDESERLRAHGSGVER